MSNLYADWEVSDQHVKVAPWSPGPRKISMAHMLILTFIADG